MQLTRQEGRFKGVSALAISWRSPHNAAGMESEAQPRRPWYGSFLVGKNPAFTLLRILFVVLVTLVLFKYVLLLTRVTGTSMEPTYRDGQVKLVNRLAYRNHAPKRGDIVVFPLGPGPDILIIKRVVALPGEMIRIVNGHIQVNGERLDEPYAQGTISQKVRDESGRSFELRTTPRPFKVPANEYFLVGDNRENTELYLEPRERILGKVIY